MTVKNVIFDLDGTILDTLDDLTDSVNAAMAQFGCEPHPRAFVRAAVGNGVRKLMVRSLPKGTPDACVDECLAAFKTHYAENMTVKTKPYPGIVALMTALRQKGVGVYVVSNKYDAAVKALCARYFGELVLDAAGEKAGIPRKPAPDGVLSLMKAAGAKAEETVYAGDSGVDVETAHNAGLKCVSVTWGFRDREDLIAAGADVIIDSPDVFWEAASGL